MAHASNLDWRWGTHVNPWLIHVNVWQKSLQYCKVISLQLIKINEKKNPSWAALALKLARREHESPNGQRSPSTGTAEAWMQL